MLTKSSLGYAAAGAGLCFIGYCVYFDHKRRNDPMYKQKLRERRRKAKEQKEKKTNESLPLNRGNVEDMQRFFLQEVQLGEELLAAGDIEGGVEHLSTAVAVCGQPQQLVQVLQSTLPPPVFQLLVQKLPTVGQRMMSSAQMSLAEDDVE